MELYLKVTADTNDADYNSSMSKISEETLIRLGPLIEAIKNQIERHNFPCGGYHSRQKSVYKLYPEIDKNLLQEFMEEYVPVGEEGVHTIVSINVYEVALVRKLL